MLTFVTKPGMTTVSPIMSKQSQIHVLSVLILIIASSVSTDHYYLVPWNELCKSYHTRTCFTLAEFASNINYLDLSSNLTLSFYPGEHLLTQRLTIKGLQSVSLTGENCASSLPTIKCLGNSGFEFHHIQNLNIVCLEFNGHGNLSYYGGAIFISRVDTVLIRGCHFLHNYVIGDQCRGGAIYAKYTAIIDIEHCLFHNNSALDQHSTSSNSNKYRSAGGAISLVKSSISSSNSHYINNRADYGGVFYVESGNVFSTNDHYTNNNAWHGGAMYAFSANISGTSDSCCGTIKIRTDTFEGNSAIKGAVIHKVGGVVEIRQSNITDNSASHKNILYVNSVSLYFTEDVNVINNYGSLYIFNTHVEFSGRVALRNNVGDSGGAITAILSHISFSAHSTITICNNSATSGGGISLIQSSMHVYNTIRLIDNQAADSGGGIYAYQSEIEFRPEQIQSSKINENTASNGGAVYVIASTILISNTHLDITLNTAQKNGGAIYIEQNSKIYIRKTVPDYHPQMLNVRLSFKNNSAEKGGAIYVADNTNVGVLCAGTVMKAYQTECFIQTLEYYSFNLSEIFINTVFSNNVAHQSGSAIYGGLLDRCTLNPIAEIGYYFPAYKRINGFDYIKATTQIDHIIDYSSQHNQALQPDYLIETVSKSDVKGLISSDAVLIEFCENNVISPNFSHPIVSVMKGETFTVSLVAVDQVGNPLNATVISSFSSKSGSGHLKDNQTRQQVTSQCTELEYNVYSHDSSAQILIHADGPCGGIGISRKTLNLHFLPCTCPVGSHPSPSENDCICECDLSTLTFCLDNVTSPTYSAHNVSKRKGEFFTIPVVAVDLAGTPVSASVISSFSYESGAGHLKDSQVLQQIGNQCTDLEYNVYSLDNSAQINLNLYVDTQCGSRGSTKTLNVLFLPCTCPFGFQQTQSDNDCICDCDQRLKQYQIISCFAENETILVETNTWIGLSNYVSGTGFVISDCPFDYCVEKPLLISLNSSDNTDKKCAYNRTGNLCGKCKQSLSLVFGSSRCQQCSSYYIFLLIPFAFAGIALVVFILLFNMTVAIGTIHGLIFFANILRADQSLFLPITTQNFLTVFISWLNLDLGIETCFYNGMDSYGKFLLQMAFPTYILLLIGAIIVLCAVSDKFATLLGNRNPVAALCTLILLSYSKLIRIIITAIQFRHLDYPDGSREIFWLYDANIPYFSISHIPRFLAAFIIFVLGTIYTTLLFFGQWFPRCSNRKIMKWTKNTKYIAFIDAYHAPFTPKHRYWMGLLLFAQITHNIVAAMTYNLVPVLSAGCVALGLILFKLLNTRVCKNRLKDSLETLFLTNIVVLVFATLYIQGKNQDQLALVNVSMAISFIFFVVIFCYHFYKYILKKGTKVQTQGTQNFQRMESGLSTSRNQMYPLELLQDEEPITPDNDIQLREPDLDVLAPIYTGDYSDPPRPESPLVYQPPKITFTVIDGRPAHRNGVPVPCGHAGQNVPKEA